MRSQALKVVHDMFAFDAASDAEEDMPVSEIKIQKTIERIVENILSNGDIMCNVLDIKNYDDYIYSDVYRLCSGSVYDSLHG